MNPQVESKRVRDLTALLVDLTERHEALVDLIDHKIQAVKRADLEALREVAYREQAIVSGIAEREGLRKKLMDLISLGLGASAKPGRAMTLSELIPYLDAADCTALLGVAGRLRLVVGRAANLNRVASLVLKTILMHLQWITAAVWPPPLAAGSYAGDGRPIESSNAKLFEVLG